MADRVVRNPYLLTNLERDQVKFYIKHGPPGPRGCTGCSDFERVIEKIVNKINLGDLQKDIKLLQALLEKAQNQAAAT